MSYFLGQAVVESCLYIITDVPVLVGIVPGNEGLVIEIRKWGVSSVLRIHYHRISNLEVKTMICSMFAASMFGDIDISKLHFMLKTTLRSSSLSSLPIKRELVFALSYMSIFIQ